jgi:cytochrome b pre-mRNA-processing protein 3
MFGISSSRRAERKAAERIYAAALAAARRPALYLNCGVPDTLQGRFEMVTLHLFPVLRRLMHDPGDDPELARLISEHFVNDMDGAFREMGVGDLSVPKRMKTLYGSFAGRISAYGSAVGEGQASLAEAIGRNIFPDAPQDDHAAALAAYLSAAVAAIRAADLAALRGGDVPFPALPAEEARG